MPAHHAKETVIFFQMKHQLSSCQHWPPTSPDLNPVDYKVWSVLQEQVYKVKVNEVDELHQRIQTGWDEFDQRVIDKAIKRWHTHLRACVEAKGSQFEHKL